MDPTAMREVALLARRLQRSLWCQKRVAAGHRRPCPSNMRPFHTFGLSTRSIAFLFATYPLHVRRLDP